MQNNEFIHDTGLNEKNSLTHLLDAKGPVVENEAVLIEYFKYFDDLKFRTILRMQNSQLCILCLNCQSLNAKFDNLKMFIDYVNDQCPISVICIQESWSHDGIDMSYFSLPNYTMVNQNRRLSVHGGLITYIHDDFAYRKLNNMFPVTVTSNLLKVFSLRFGKKVLKDRNILSVIYVAYHLTYLMM